MKTITIEQINSLLQTIYQTNIPAQSFDAVKKFLSELPDVKSEEKTPLPKK
jgi:hypothetical protein